MATRHWVRVCEEMVKRRIQINLLISEFCVSKRGEIGCGQRRLCEEIVQFKMWLSKGVVSLSLYQKATMRM